MKLFVCGFLVVACITLSTAHPHHNKNTNVIKVRDDEVTSGSQKKTADSTQESCGVIQIKKNATSTEKNVAREAEKGEFPWLVTLHLGRAFCVGSLLDSQFVLTTAHCVKRRGDCHSNKEPDCAEDMTPEVLRRVTVRLGDYKLSSTVEGPSYEDRNISYVIPHENSTLESFNSDIALIKLSRPVTFSKYIQPVCLPNFRASYEGMESDLTGSNIFWDGHSKQQLNTYRSNIWSKENCKSVISELPVTDEVLCAGANITYDNPIFTAHGEPLTVNSNSQTVQVGMSILNNKLNRNDATESPFYLAMYQYVDWINENRKNYK